MRKQITIHYPDLLEDVAKTSEYIGVKMEGEGAETAYGRISVTTEDTATILQYMEDACAGVLEKMRSFSPEFGKTPSSFILTFEFPASFDTNLLVPMATDLRNCVVNSALAKWFRITNRTEAAEYAEVAAAKLDRFHRMACQRKKPTPPSYE